MKPIRRSIRKGAWLVLLLATLLLSACSPEYTRVRGDGSGADVGNRTLGPSMDIHGQTNPSFGEPPEGRAVQTK